VQQVIKQLPSSAGVYQYFDANGKLLYVGKAKNLKNRVKSYWRFNPIFTPNPTQSPRIIKMLHEATRLEYIVVATEEDALILENSLIKQLKPKYNILLRDDKTYPYIYIDESVEFPRFEITRKLIKGKNITYYGPFPAGGRALLDALYEVYPLVQKKACLREGKACLFYQIKKCLAPCEGKITSQAYKEIIQKAKTSIVKRTHLITTLEEKMVQYLSHMNKLVTFLKHIRSIISIMFIGTIIVTILYYFFLFFAYDMNKDFIRMHQCDKKGGAYIPENRGCDLQDAWNL